MLEKLAIAATLTLSLHIFLGMGSSTGTPKSSTPKLPETPTQTVSQLIR